MVAMTTMLGSRASAETEFDQSLRIARLTPFDTRNVVSLRRQLLGAGIRDTRERDVMTGVLADLAALNPEDATVMQRLGLAIGQIKGAGRLRGQELNQLVQAGLSREALYAEIGREMGLRGSAASINSQVDKLKQAGRITDRITFAAMARAVMRQTNTTEVGQFSAAQSTTIPGLLSTLGSAVPELLLGRDASGTRLFESAGMQAFKKFLQDIIALLSSTSATGQRLQRIMRGVIDQTFGLLSGIGGAGTKNQKGGLEGIFTAALDAVEKLIAAIKVVVAWGRAFGEGFGATFLPIIQAAAPALQEMFGVANGGEGTTALDVFRAIGNVLGTIAGLSIAIPTAMWRMVGEMVDAARWLWDLMPFWFKFLFEDSSSSAPQPALAGANGVVSAGPGQPGIRPVVSQPNVTVNVAATAAQGVGVDDIASAVGSTIPPIVQTSAERASGAP